MGTYATCFMPHGAVSAGGVETNRDIHLSSLGSDMHTLVTRVLAFGDAFEALQ